MSEARNERNELTRPFGSASPETSGRGELCTFKQGDDPQDEYFVLKYDDTDRGDQIFSEREAARTAFAISESLGWSCHLFELMKRQNSVISLTRDD